jgi:hypothetical protein
VSVLSPEQLGVPRASLQDLAGGDKAENAQIIRDLFGGAQGPKRNALLVNAGAALYVAGKAGSIRDGMVLAAQTIDSGAAARTLDAYVKVTQGLPKRLGGAVDQYSVAKTGKVFQVLRSAAKAHKTLTYAEVGVQAGMHPRAVSPCLHEIQAWCDAWRLPHISALVVVKETQLPTRSYSPDGNVMTPEKFEALKQEVFQFNWDPVRFSP